MKKNIKKGISVFLLISLLITTNMSTALTQEMGDEITADLVFMEGPEEEPEISDAIFTDGAFVDEAFTDGEEDEAFAEGTDEEIVFFADGELVDIIELDAAGAGEIVLVDDPNGIKITTDSDRTVYVAGDTINFNVTYTNKTGSKLQDWNIVPSLKPSVGVIEGGNLSEDLSDLSIGNSVTIPYKVTLNEDIEGEQNVAFLVEVKKGKKDGKIWNWNTVVVDAEATVLVKALTGTKVIQGEDGGSQLNAGIVKPVFTIKNYNEEETGYTYQFEVKKNGVLLLQDTDYSLNWSSEMSGSLAGKSIEKLAPEIVMYDIPKAGDKVEVSLIVTDQNDIITQKDVSVVRPITAVKITTDSEGPYLAGTTVKFTACFTNNTDKDLSDLFLVPSIDDPTLQRANSGTLVKADIGKVNHGGNSGQATFSIKIPDDYDGTDWIRFMVKTQDDDDISIANGEDDYAFKVNPLKGVMVVDATDAGSTIGVGKLKADFTLKNYNADTTWYGYEVLVEKDGTLLAAETDYTLEWTTPLTNSVPGKGSEIGIAEIRLATIPKVGETYKVSLLVIDENEGRSQKGVSIKRPNTSIQITPDTAGPYLAGTTVKFTVRFTNNTDSDLHDLFLVPTIDDQKLQSVNSDTLVKADIGDVNHGGKFNEATFSIKIPDDYDGTERIRFIVETQDEDGNSIANGEDDYAFQVIPLKGVKVIAAKDGGSAIASGLLNTEFTLKNYDAEERGYEYRVEVTKNGQPLTESDYALNWTTSLANPLSGEGTDTGVVTIQLNELPVPGATYTVALFVTDPTEGVTTQSVSYKKPETSVKIIPDTEGPYKAGSTVNFTVEFTNNTGSEIANDWKIIPDINHTDLHAVNQAELTAATMAKLVKGGTASAHFSITIPEDFNDTNWIYFTAKVQDKDGKDVLNGMDDYPFRVSPLNGVKVIEGRELDSKIEEKLLMVEYDLKNYSSSDSRYTYKIQVVSDDIEISPENYTVEWTKPLPGKGFSDGDFLTMGGGETASAIVQIKLNENDNYVAPFKVTLSVTDIDCNETTSQAVHIEAASLEKLIPAGILNNGGLDLLYYGNVARDDRVPFRNADELRAVLSNSSEKRAAEIWNRYKYDLYDPNCFVGDPSCEDTSGKNMEYDYGEYGALDKDKYKNDYPRFEDDLLAYPKDGGNSPFHASIDSKIEPLKYVLEEGGINFEDYFKKMKKTAGPNDGEQNTKREYTVELSAETNPRAVRPRLYIFQIQTSWQMFDMLHANATKSNPIITTAPVNMAVGSCANNTAMANLYDIKQALIRFAEYLKEYDDGSTMIAVTNVQHGGTNSMIGGLSFSNNMDDVISGLIGWDTFGDCEHVHYSSQKLDTAIANIDQINSRWTDKNGTKIEGEVDKTVIIIGGPTENSDGSSGYGIELKSTSVTDKNNNRNPKLDHVYGIRVNEGTSVSGKTNYLGKQVISWLDIDANQQLFAQEGNGFYEAPSEEAVYDALVDIFQKSERKDGFNESVAVNNVTLTDTIQKEFQVKDVEVCYVDQASGQDKKLPKEDYTVNQTPMGDGSTLVSVTYNKIEGHKKIKVKIHVKAKKDYIGSNNVYTNVNSDGGNGSEKIGPQIAGYTRQVTNSGGQTEIKSYGPRDFKETPQVNVVISFDVKDGLTVTKNPGDKVDLKELAYQEKKQNVITQEVEALINKYPQINGTLTYQWVDSDGNPLGTASSVKVANGISDPPAIPSHEYTVTKEDAGQTKTFSLKVTFTPEKIGEENINDNPVLEKEADGAVNINVPGTAGKGVLNLKKIGEKGNLLGGVEFELYRAKKEPKDNWKKAEDTPYKSGSTSSEDEAAGLLKIEEIASGDYLLYETKTLDGYILPQNPWRVNVSADGTLKIWNNNTELTPNTSGQYVIVNQECYKLPSTGGMGTDVFRMGGILVLLLGIFNLIIRKWKFE